MKQEPVRIIYILGMGRSGSTLMDILLGNHPEIESFGDLIELTRTGWLQNGKCSCGAGGNECVFWATVKKRWFAQTGLERLEEYVELQNRYEHIRSIPRLVREQSHPTPAFRRYAELTEAFFRIASAVSGKPIIADSSKTPGRAYALSLVPGLDVRVIHLVRDIRGVVFSHKKTLEKPVSTMRTTCRWVMVNRLSDWVCSRLPRQRCIRIRYEDLCDNPREALAKVGALSAVDFSQTIQDAMDGKELAIGHVIGGNRIRMQKSVSLKPADREWLTMLSNTEHILIKAIAFFIMRKYRYL